MAEQGEVREERAAPAKKQFRCLCRKPNLLILYKFANLEYMSDDLIGYLAEKYKSSENAELRELCRCLLMYKRGWDLHEEARKAVGVPPQDPDSPSLQEEEEALLHQVEPTVEELRMPPPASSPHPKETLPLFQATPYPLKEEPEDKYESHSPQQPQEWSDTVDPTADQETHDFSQCDFQSHPVKEEPVDEYEEEEERPLDAPVPSTVSHHPANSSNHAQPQAMDGVFTALGIGKEAMMMAASRLNSTNNDLDRRPREEVNVDDVVVIYDKRERSRERERRHGHNNLSRRQERREESRGSRSNRSDRHGSQSDHRRRSPQSRDGSYRREKRGDDNRDTSRRQRSPSRSRSPRRERRRSPDQSAQSRSRGFLNRNGSDSSRQGYSRAQPRSPLRSHWSTHSSRQEDVPSNCTFCGSGEHNSEVCHVFLDFTERQQRVKDLGLCWHCLQPFHPYRCKAKDHTKPCQRCHNHLTHTALCKLLIQEEMRKWSDRLNKNT